MLNETLAAEIHALSRTDSGNVVITTQHWIGKSRDVFVVVRNGAVVEVTRGTRQAVAERFERARADLAPIKVTAREAWANLALVDVTPGNCGSVVSCGVELPHGGFRCSRCGRSPGRVAAGTLSGVNRRPAVDFRMSNAR